MSQITKRTQCSSYRYDRTSFLRVTDKIGKNASLLNRFLSIHSNYKDYEIEITEQDDAFNFIVWGKKEELTFTPSELKQRDIVMSTSVIDQVLNIVRDELKKCNHPLAFGQLKNIEDKITLLGIKMMRKGE